MKQLEVTETDAGQRLDKYLCKVLAQAPKGFLYKMLRKKNITLNGRKAAGGERLSPGDQVQMFFSQETLDKFSAPKQEGREASARFCGQEPEVVYEDGQVLLVNKPCGMLSQKSRPGDASLADWVREYLQAAREGCGAAGFSPGICNRLDRNTSGIVTAGKSVRAQQELSRLFHEKSLGKYYLCPVRGVVREAGRLRGYLQKSGKDNKVSVVGEWRQGNGSRETAGREYIETAYRPLGDNGNLTLLEVQLVTGKTHQIRAHMAQMGHPLTGDGKYGGQEWASFCARQWGCRCQLLHAWRLEFPVCRGVLAPLSGKAFEASLPAAMESFLQNQHLEGFIPWKKSGNKPS